MMTNEKKAASYETKPVVAVAAEAKTDVQLREADLKYPTTYRPYQAECLDIIHQKQLEAEQKAAEGKGPGRYLVVLATGLGKTYIFTHMDRRGGRTLILSHRDELVRQPQRYYEGVSFGVEKADKHATDEEVVSASVMTLCRDQRLKAFKPDDFKTIIVDEAHHASAKSYQKVLDYFSGAEMIIGFTATAKRGDGVALSVAFDEIIFHHDLRWGIQNGYLSRIRSYEVKADYNLASVSKTAGDFNQGQLESALMTGDSVAVTAKTYIKFCHDAGKHTLIYCVTTGVAVSLLETIHSLLSEEERGKVKMLLGDTPADERAAILKGFNEGEITGIVNCMVLTEGTDLPVCDAIINMRPTCNDSLYQQIVGRGTRLYEGKDHCIVLDIVPDQRNARKLCTAPTLFGIDPNALTEKQREQVCSLETDLLDTCDSLAGYITTAESIEVELRAVHSILDEVYEMLDKAKDHTLQEFANRYLQAQEQKWTDADADCNFGSLAVTIRADDTHRFSIRPSWDERIYISSPDILDNVSMEMHVFGSFCKLPDEVIQFTGVCSMKDAVELTKMYCLTRMRFYEHCWSRRVKNLWANQECTDKQAVSLQHAAFFKNRGIDTSNPSALSKLEASEMIDLMRTSKGAEKQLKELKKDQKSNAQHPTDGCLLLERPEMKRFHSEQDIFNAFSEATKKEFDKSSRSLAELDETVTLTIPSETTYTPPTPDDSELDTEDHEEGKAANYVKFPIEIASEKVGYMTPRQQQIIEALVKQASNEDMDIDIPNRMDWSYREAHAIIAILSAAITAAKDSTQYMEFVDVSKLLDSIMRAKDGWHEFKLKIAS